MTYTEATVTLGMTVNVGNYESVKVAETLTAKLENSDPGIHTCLDKMYADLKENLITKVQNIKRKE